MDYSQRMNMIDMFTDPPEYRPPATVEEMAGSVDYPNLNSQQYRMTRKTNGPTALNPCLELAARNSVGQVILVGNNYMGRRWESSFYGWETAADVPDQSKACFKRQCRYSITALQFTQDPNLFLLGSDKGSVELWSTRNPARGDGYSLYQVDVQSEHIEAVSAMDLFHGDENKLVTGSHDGCHVTQDAPVPGSSLYNIKDFIQVAVEGSSARSTSQRNSLRDILQLIDTPRDLINNIFKCHSLVLFHP